MGPWVTFKGRKGPYAKTLWMPVNRIVAVIENSDGSGGVITEEGGAFDLDVNELQSLLKKLGELMMEPNHV